MPFIAAIAHQTVDHRQSQMMDLQSRMREIRSRDLRICSMILYVSAKKLKRSAEVDTLKTFSKTNAYHVKSKNVLR